MSQASVNALSAVEFGVPDVQAAADFYVQTWGLKIVKNDAASCYLRATGADYYVLALHRRDKPGFIRVRLGAEDRSTVDSLFEHVSKTDAAVLSTPGALETPGGGYGFSFRDVEGREFQIISEVQQHADATHEDDRPYRLSHIVFNSVDYESASAFLRDALGFRVRDRTRRVFFMGCNSDHHCIAVTNRGNSSVSHVAYELPNLEAVLRGCGRVKQDGLKVEWGVGRHGTGDNVFAYFVDPNGFAIEYTAEMQQIDEATHVPGTPETNARRPHADAWGLADPPTERFLAALEGTAQFKTQ